MAFNLAATVAKARRALHNTLRVEALYTATAGATPVTLHVRWHNRQLITGNIVEIGYSDVVEGVNRVIFDVEELAEQSVVPQRGGEVAITNVYGDGIVLILDHLEPKTGPINQAWGVVQK